MKYKKCAVGVKWFVFKLYPKAKIKLRDIKFPQTLPWFRILKWHMTCLMDGEGSVSIPILGFQLNKMNKWCEKMMCSSSLIWLISFALACHWRRHLNGANWLEQINIWSLSGRSMQNLPVSALSYLLRQEGVPWVEVCLWLKSGCLWLLLGTHWYSWVLVRDFPGCARYF